MIVMVITCLNHAFTSSVSIALSEFESNEAENIQKCVQSSEWHG